MSILSIFSSVSLLYGDMWLVLAPLCVLSESKLAITETQAKDVNQFLVHRFDCMVTTETLTKYLVNPKQIDEALAQRGNLFMRFLIYLGRRVKQSWVELNL